MQKQKAVRMPSPLLPNPNQPPTEHTIKTRKQSATSLTPLFSWDAYEV